MAGIEGYDGAIGSLQEFDLADVSTPLNELRRYLLMHADSLYKVHPRRFEEIVCSVFRDLGYIARATAYTHDGGVDVVLENASAGKIGVQVKRHARNRPIEVEQIRSFAGALLVNGYTKGVFVTTSSFRRGARAVAERLGTIGYPIEIVDAARFFEMLGMAQLKSFTIDEKRYASWVLSRGVHLGSGAEREFVAGESLMDRPVIGMTMLSGDLIDLTELPAATKGRYS